jgi:hypothetical protein
VALVPHYTQHKGISAVTGAGSGQLGCECGQSLLISGYDARNFLDIAISCANCGRISETPGLPEGVTPPPAATLVERGAENPPSTVGSDTVLISREEMERLATLYQPRLTDTNPFVISDELLDDLEAQRRQWTGVALDSSLPIYNDRPLDWAVAHFRERLKDPGWVTFSADSDMLAIAVIAAFRDLIATWAHHPLFGAMIGTAAAQGFSFHTLAIFGAARSLVASGNRIGFAPPRGAPPRIASFQLMLGADEQMSVAVNRFDRFEWPNGGLATPQAVRAAVIEAMASVQGTINRLRPGMLVLSAGASEGTFDQLLVDSIAAAVASHGKRHRGLAAVSAIFPKVSLTRWHREARFGYSFYPVANRNHSIGQSVRIGSRADHAGFVDTRTV